MRFEIMTDRFQIYGTVFSFASADTVAAESEAAHAILPCPSLLFIREKKKEETSFPEKLKITPRSKMRVDACRRWS